MKFQWASFVFLALISSYFTYNLAFELGQTIAEKIALIAGSLAIETIKLYALVHANGLLTSKRKLKLPKLIVLYGAYSFVALYSLIACFGYSLSTVDRITETSVIVSKTDSIKIDKQNLDTLDMSMEITYNNIKTLQMSLSNVPLNNITRRLSIMKLIREDQASLEELSKKKMPLQAIIDTKQSQEQAQKVITKKTMYEVIGKTVGITPKWVAFIILFVFAISIELGIFITSPHNFLYQ